MGLVWAIYVLAFLMIGTGAQQHRYGTLLIGLGGTLAGCALVGGLCLHAWQVSQRDKERR